MLSFNALQTHILVLIAIFTHQKKQNSLAENGNGECPYHNGNGPYNDVNIPGCWFFKLPHKVLDFCPHCTMHKSSQSHI